MLLYGAAAPFGDESIAAVGIAARILTIGALPITGFCIGAQAVLGFGWGARDFARILKTATFMLLMTVALSVAYSAAVVVFARPLVRLFSDSDKVTENCRIDLHRLSSVFWIVWCSESRDDDASVVRESTPQCGCLLGEVRLSLHTGRTVTPRPIGFQQTSGQSGNR
ncbi:MATE family efflux transporter [Bradyrhizobium sp. RT9a]|uniref:MATE family efflux transporter n=1 Tax=Bradyrhizobium sp. RT9a TaxID=3156384 RepID=UPI003396F2F1